MCFPGRGMHITRYMGLMSRKDISQGIFVSQVGEHISLGICVSQIGEHISLGICFLGREYISLGIPYLPADRPHFFPEKMGPKLGLRPIRGYKRFDTSLKCKRSHGRTLNWRFYVHFQLLLTYNTYN